jgi:hypothetical protein
MLGDTIYANLALFSDEFDGPLALVRLEVSRIRKHVDKLLITFLLVHCNDG